MKRIDLIGILLLILAVVIVYYPVFYSRYCYTDEAGQLWDFNKGINFNTYTPQGRWIAWLLFQGLFGSIHTIRGLIGLRVFSLFGWIACLPAWYYMIDRVFLKNGFPKWLAWLALVFLVCIPPFAVSIGWASCLEMFVACTAGLVSGWLADTGIRNWTDKKEPSRTTMGLSILFGLISLFTYQNGFGCFFLPFFIRFLADKKIGRQIARGIGVSMLIFAAYYLLFRLSLHVTGQPASDRTAFAVDPFRKLIFLLTRPLAAAFHLTFLFNERSSMGMAVYILLALTTLGVSLRAIRSLRDKFRYMTGLFIFFALIYLPSLLVKENYASNRTLLALDLAVFFLIAVTLFSLLKKDSTRWIATATLAALFLINGWYNFNTDFRRPLIAEYRAIGDFLTLHDNPGIDTIYFIRPGEDAFEKRYGIAASWDEFGVPSTAKPWTPEPLIRQMIADHDGDRARAERITIKSWPDKASFMRSGAATNDGTLLIDAEKLIAQPQSDNP